MNVTLSKMQGITDSIALNNIDPLPDEFISAVFRHLNAIDFVKSREVCKKWNKILSQPSFWKTLDLRKLFPSLKIYAAEEWRSSLNLACVELTVEDVTLNILELSLLRANFFPYKLKTMQAPRY